LADTSNWEFAAVVTAVVMGLSGLLLFTLIGTLGAWRVFQLANRAAKEAEKASLAVQDLARHLASRTAQQLPIIDLRDAAGDLDGLRMRTDDLIDQQARLQDAVRHLVEAGVLGSQGNADKFSELEGALGRLQDSLTRIAAAVGSLGPEDSAHGSKEP
jgi:hypothetical protein